MRHGRHLPLLSRAESFVWRDGNGRVGRLLVTFLLCERKVLSLPLLYLSWFFKKHRAEYYDRLQAVRIDGDWEAWLGFFLRGVQEIATEAVVRARKIIELRERARGVASERGGRKSANLLRAIDSLFKQPLVTANSLAKEIGVSFVTANGIALTLADLELLTEETRAVEAHAQQRAALPARRGSLAALRSC
jgi:Fic family protein